MDKVNFENMKMEIHIDYKDGVKMTDFINYIDSINKGINDVNRKYGGLSNRSIGKFPSIITCIKPGSIALDISLYVIPTITLSIIANAIYDQIKKHNKGKVIKLEGKNPQIIINDHIIIIENFDR